LSCRKSFFSFVFGALFWISFLVLPSGAFAATHTVSKGDTLWGISQMYDVTVSGLMAANGIQDSMIYTGQVINVPGNVTQPGEGSGKVTYTVQPGDTLYMIGLYNGIDYHDIMTANHLQGASIYPGMVLTLPGANGSGAATPSSTAGTPQVSRGGYFDRPSAADVELLARLITAEADNQPYEAKVAVGAVVLNRTRSKDYTNTISEVIYQKNGGTYQFEPVMNGYINRPASADSIRAAREALSGVDPTNGALYFFCDWVTNQWLTSKKVARKIGETVFSY
jgi:LysM repeat protein